MKNYWDTILTQVNVVYAKTLAIPARSVIQRRTKTVMPIKMSRVPISVPVANKRDSSPLRLK